MQKGTLLFGGRWGMSQDQKIAMDKCSKFSDLYHGRKYSDECGGSSLAGVRQEIREEITIRSAKEVVEELEKKDPKLAELIVEHLTSHMPYVPWQFGNNFKSPTAFLKEGIRR